jgi:arylsulfatase A
VSFDGRSFFPQLRGEGGSPREWRYTWYNPSGGAKAKAEFAHDHRFKLYADGRFFDVAADELERHPLDPKSLDAPAGAARTKLQGALDQFKGPRPEAIEKQGQPFGTGKSGAKKPGNKGKNRKKRAGD